MRVFFPAKLIFWVLILLYIAGCSHTQPSATIPTSEPVFASATDEKQTASPPATIVPAQPTYTLLPVAKGTPSVLLTPPVDRPTPAQNILPPLLPTTTLTPISTLPADEALARVLAIYENNGGCQPPCWWGITPGVTTWQEIYERLAPLGEVRITPIDADIFVSRFIFWVPAEIEPLGYISASMVFEQARVQAINTNSRWIMLGFDYSLAGLLEYFGTPEEIWINIHSNVIYPYYELTLYYPQQRLSFGYLGEISRSNEKLTFCPQDIFSENSFPPGIMFWVSREPIDFKALANTIVGNLFTRDEVKYFRLEEVVSGGWDEGRFFDTYSDPNASECITILQE